MKRDYKRMTLRAAVCLLATVLLATFSLTANAGRSYKSLVKKWTEKDRVFAWENFEAQVIWRATYQSGEFRDARIERYTDLYDLEGEELAKFKKDESDEAGKYDVFFLSVYAGSSKWYDAGRDISLWRFVLETSDGKKQKQTSLSEITQTQVVRTLYPYVDKWSKTYEVKFPKLVGPETKKITLKMVGVPADSELSWKLK